MSDIQRWMDAMNWAKYLRLTRIAPFHYPVFVEIFILLAFLLVILVFSNFYISKKIGNKILYKLFFYNWLFRSIGGLGLMVFYKHYYGWGDMWSYITDSITLSNFVIYSPFLFIKFAFVSIYNHSFFKALYDHQIYEFFYYFGHSLNYYIDYNSEMVSLLSVPFSVLGFNSYYGTTLLIATASAWVGWLGYLVFVRYFPRYWREGAIGLLFMPSVWAWLAAPLKETYAMIGLNLVVYGIYQILENKRLGWVFLVLFGIWLSYVVKPYVPLAFLPFLFVWVYLRFNKYSRHLLYRYFFSPILFFLFISLSYFAVRYLSDSTGKYKIENILNQAYLVYDDLTRNESYYAQTGGSTYNLGEFEPTIEGVIKKFPVATATALFRPFLWEAKKPVILLAAIETTMVLLLLIWNLFSSGSLRVLKKALSHPFLVFCFGYGLFFLFMVGLTSGNFGNLVRYRLPGYTFFLSALLVTFAMAKDEATRNRMR